MLDTSAEVLNSFGLNQLTHERELLGLWHEDKKLASVGIAVKKMTTFHGLALNLTLEKNVMQAMSKFNPCGMTVDRYSSVEDLLGHSISREDFTSQFIKLFLKDQ